MARYFQPATAEGIRSAGGRPVQADLHSGMVSRLGRGEVLVWHLDRCRFRLVADVTEPVIAMNFCRQVDDGDIASLGLYAMPTSAAGWDKGKDD